MMRALPDTGPCITVAIAKLPSCCACVGSACGGHAAIPAPRAASPASVRRPARILQQPAGLWCGVLKNCFLGVCIASHVLGFCALCPALPPGVCSNAMFLSVHMPCTALQCLWVRHFFQGDSHTRASLRGIQVSTAIRGAPADPPAPMATRRAPTLGTSQVLLHTLMAATCTSQAARILIAKSIDFTADVE